MNRKMLLTLVGLTVAATIGVNGNCPLLDGDSEFDSETGACCTGSGENAICIGQTRAQCESVFGSFEEGVGCAFSSCQTNVGGGNQNQNINQNDNSSGNTGSCCEQNGFCQDGVTSAACDMVAGEFSTAQDCAGRVEECSENASDTSGCCLNDSTCVNLTQEECNQQGGTFSTQNCTNIFSCDFLIMGACCDGSSCSISSKADCDVLSRDFRGGGTDCSSGSVCP